MFVQYNIADASPSTIQASTSQSVDAGALAAAGRAQLSVADGTDILAWNVDHSGTPVLVANTANPINLSQITNSIDAGTVVNVQNTTTAATIGSLALDGTLGIDGTVLVTD